MEERTDESKHCTMCYPIFSGKKLTISIKDIILSILSYSLCPRLIILLLLLQAAVLWLGYSLNIILQLLFIPFLYPSVGSIYNVVVFLACSCITPGIISFSSHYFWFIMQFTFHCYTNDESVEERPKETSLGNNNGPDDKESDKFKTAALLCFPEKKHVYRCSIIIGMMFYMILRRFIISEDMFTTLFATLGFFPLFIMAILHVLHLLSTFFFVRESVKTITESNSSYTCADSQHKKPYFTMTVTLTVLTLAYHGIHSEKQIQSILSYCIIAASFSTYILLFISTSADINSIDDNRECCHPHNQSMKERLKLWICSLLRRRLIKIFQISYSMRKNQQYHAYRLFIVIILHVMLISLNRIFTMFFTKKILLILTFHILSIVPIFLWIPPIFSKDTNRSILYYQMSTVEFLILLMHWTSLVGFIFLLLLSLFNNWLATTFLCALLAYEAMLLYYYKQYRIKRSSLSLGLKQWIKSHESTGIYLQAFSIVFIILSLIGFLGFIFGCSIYVETMHDADNSLLHPMKLSGSFDNITKEHYRMQACYWNFNGFTMQDMTLFAALAYLPTKELKSELKHFYPKDEIEFVDQFQNYKAYGHGEITYYTLDTRDAVIVVIRGTTLSYEWLIDFDIWIESAIKQVLSTLFPWSKLYPRGVHKEIVAKMALLENFFSERLVQSSKRFFVQQMIEVLKAINVEYNNKPLVLVGHSLGGGLAQLAGVAMNNTVAVISICGPGIAYSRAKYRETKDVLMDTINHRVFNIIHDRDLVPWADPQVGLVQKLTCPKSFSRLQCHQINPIFCNFLRSCGNPRKFKINENIC